MKERTTKRLSLGAAVVASASLLLLLSAGTALAVPAAHSNIVLKGPDGLNITDLAAGANAFSMRMTCGTATCHDGATLGSDGNPMLSYDELERHNAHAQLAANDHEGWNPANPDGTSWQSGPSPMGKNWVSGQGHIGAW